jgi:hypothetical protein
MNGPDDLRDPTQPTDRSEQLRLDLRVLCIIRLLQNMHHPDTPELHSPSSSHQPPPSIQEQGRRAREVKLTTAVPVSFPPSS